MQILLSSRNFSVIALQKFAFPVELALLEFAILRRERFEPRRAADPITLDLARRGVRRLDRKPALLLAHTHFTPGFDAHAGGQAKRDGIPRFECLGAIFLGHDALRIYIMYIHG